MNSEENILIKKLKMNYAFGLQTEIDSKQLKTIKDLKL